MTASLARQNEKLRLVGQDIAAAMGRMDNVLKVLRGHGLDAWVPLAEDAIRDLNSACSRLSEARYAMNQPEWFGPGQRDGLLDAAYAYAEAAEKRDQQRARLGIEPMDEACG